MRKLVWIVVIWGLFSLALHSGQETALKQSEERVAFELLSRIAQHIDASARKGCWDKERFDYFPQVMNLVVSWEGKTPSIDYWNRLKQGIRRIAPNVLLYQKPVSGEESYQVHIMSVDGAEAPIARVIYRHSIFSFNIFREASLLGQGDVAIKDRPNHLKTSRALVPTKMEAAGPMSLEMGSITFHPSSFEPDLHETDWLQDESVFNAVKDYESSLPEKDSWYRDGEQIKRFEVQAKLYKREPRIAYAVGGFRLLKGDPRPFHGSPSKRYLLVKLDERWRVVETDTQEYTPGYAGICTN